MLINSTVQFSFFIHARHGVQRKHNGTGRLPGTKTPFCDLYVEMKKAKRTKQCCAEAEDQRDEYCTQ